MGNCNDEQGKVSGTERERERGNNKEDCTGGYMAGTHKMHKTNYGPDSPLPAKAKIFCMIQHHIIGNAQIRMAIPMSVIERETGVERRTMLRCLKDLEKDKMLLVERRSIGKMKLDNIYRLHPSRYGENPLPQMVEKPTFQVIYGGKFVDPSDKGGTNPSDKNITSAQAQDSDKNITNPSDKNVATKPPQEPHPEPQPPKDKTVLRPTKTSKDNTGGHGKLKGLSWEAVKNAVLVNYPNDTYRLDEAFRVISRDRVFQGVQVKSVVGFILKGWQYQRDAFAFVDELMRQKTETKPEPEPFDQEASDAAREIAMKFIRNIGK